MGKNIITYTRKKEKNMLIKEKPVLKNLDAFLAYAKLKKGELSKCSNGSRQPCSCQWTSFGNGIMLPWITAVAAVSIQLNILPGTSK